MRHTILNWSTIHEHGQAWYSHLQLRKKVFVDKQHWDIPHSDRVEWDQFDTDFTFYSLVLDRNDRCVACARMNPTIQPYMIGTIFSHLLSNDPPVSPWVWEGTRYAIDPTLDRDRSKAAQAMVIAGMVDFALKRKIQGFLGLMPLAVYALLRRLGCTIIEIGPETTIDGRRTCVAFMPARRGALAALEQLAKPLFPIAA